MTPDITTPDIIANPDAPATEMTALRALKLNVVHQLALMCAEQGVCDTAVARLWDTRKSGVDMSGVDRPTYQTFRFEVPVTGTKTFEAGGYNRAIAAKGAQASLDAYVREGYIADGATVRNVSFGPLTIDQAELSAITPPAMQPDNDEILAFKAAVREFARQQVEVAGSIYRRQVNPYLRNLGIAELEGPKNWTFELRVPALPNVVAQYKIENCRTEEAALAELARVRTAEGDTIPTSRLKIPASMLSATPVLTEVKDR